MRRLFAFSLLAFAAAASPVAAPSVSVQVTARSIQPGEVVVLTIDAPASAGPSPRVEAFGTALTPYPIGASAWRVLIGIDLDATIGRHPVTITTGPASAPQVTTYPLTVRSKTFPTRRLTVAPKYVNPPPDVQQRILDEAARLNALWAGSATSRLWRGRFRPPVPQPANSAFGTRSIFNGQPRSPHGGADFPSAAGTPVHAPNAGRVVLVGNLYYTGWTIVVDHGLGLVSLFAHLSEVDVQEGALVSTGDLLGRVGATGRVTGPHLHWTVRLNGARVDPLSLMAVAGSARPTAGPASRPS